MEEEKAAERQVLFEEVHCCLLYELCRTFGVTPARKWRRNARRLNEGRQRTTRLAKGLLSVKDSANLPACSTEEVFNFPVDDAQKREPTKAGLCEKSRFSASRLGNPGIVAVLCGASGVGKTWLSRIFTNHARGTGRFAGGVFYLHARDELSLQTSMCRMMARLGLDAWRGRGSEVQHDQDRSWCQIQRLLTRLHRLRDCCVVVDGADDKDALQIDGKFGAMWSALLPNQAHCLNLLVITQQGVIPEALAKRVTVQMEMLPLSPIASTWMLARLTKLVCEHRQLPTTKAMLDRHLTSSCDLCSSLANSQPSDKAQAKDVRSKQLVPSLPFVFNAAILDSRCVGLTVDRMCEKVLPNSLENIGNTLDHASSLTLSGLPQAIFLLASATPMENMSLQSEAQLPDCARAAFSTGQSESSPAGPCCLANIEVRCMQNFQALSEPAQEFLSVCAFLCPDSIHPDIFSKFGSAATKLPPNLFSYLYGSTSNQPGDQYCEADVRHRLNLLISELHSFSFGTFMSSDYDTTISLAIRHQEEASAFCIHRMVCSLVKRHLLQDYQSYLRHLAGALDLITVSTVQAPSAQYSCLVIFHHIHHLCSDSAAATASNPGAVEDGALISLADLDLPSHISLAWLQVVSRISLCDEFISPLMAETYLHFAQALRSKLPLYEKDADDLLDEVIKAHNRVVHPTWLHIPIFLYKTTRVLSGLDMDTARHLLCAASVSVSCYHRYFSTPMHVLSDTFGQTTPSTMHCLEAEHCMREETTNYTRPYNYEFLPNVFQDFVPNFSLSEACCQHSKLLRDISVVMLCSAGNLNLARIVADRNCWLEKQTEIIQAFLNAYEKGIGMARQSVLPESELSSAADNSQQIDYFIFKNLSSRFLSLKLLIPAIIPFIMLYLIYGQMQPAIVAFERLLAALPHDKRLSGAIWMGFIFLVKFVAGYPLPSFLALIDDQELD